MASAVLRLWPEAKLGVGPVVDDGFYYDIDISGVSISEEDFSSIELEMHKIIKEDQEFKRSEMPIADAIKWSKERAQPYKTELLNDLQRAGTTEFKDLTAEEIGTLVEEEKSGSKVNNVSFYTNGEFIDLCRGPHVKSTKNVGPFKLMRLAGAYWRSDVTRPQMQRLYGVAFTTKEELAKHIEMLEEAKLRDHRKLGRELDLFTISELVGSGLPLFTPRGTILKEKLDAYSQQLRSVYGYQRVSIPYITKTDLYKTSGHWEKFGDELFLVKSQETSDELVLKPMNCPHHTQIYASQPRSYKDLPIKYMESTAMYRDEKSGELHGLSRVRSISIDDGHVFCRDDQIEEIAGELLDVAGELYNTIDMKLSIELSFRDEGEAYLGDKVLWEKAQSQLEIIAKSKNLEYKIVEGEAAFYGPKIDFKVEDAIGRTWQVATIQLDFVQPARFKLEYTDSKGKAVTPVMIHSAILGSVERFLSVYIEHTAGRFPFWLAPEQIRILTINDESEEYISKVAKLLDSVVLMEPLKYNELRFSVDERNESLGKKIKEAELLKVPVMLIIGPKDVEAQEVSIRTHSGEEKVKLSDLQRWVESYKG